MRTIHNNSQSKNSAPYDWPTQQGKFWPIGRLLITGKMADGGSSSSNAKQGKRTDNGSDWKYNIYFSGLDYHEKFTATWHVSQDRICLHDYKAKSHGELDNCKSTRVKDSPPPMGVRPSFRQRRVRRCLKSQAALMRAAAKVELLAWRPAYFC